MDLRYLLWRARWAVAAALTVLAVGAILSWAAPRYVTVEAARLTRDIGVGDTLDAGDVETVPLPAAGIPETTIAAPDAIGRSALATLPAGTVLTPGLLAGPDALAADPAGRVIVSVGLSTLSAGLAHPGARVILYAPPEGDAEQARSLGEATIVAVHDREGGLIDQTGIAADLAVAPERGSFVLAWAQKAPLLVAASAGPP